MNKDFKKLQGKCIIANTVYWANSTMPTPAVDDIRNLTALEYDRELKRFIKNHPGEVISKYYAPYILPTSVTKKHLAHDTAMWNKYQALKKDKLNPDKQYYALFQKSIDNYKWTMDFYGKPVGELSYMNDHALGDYATIKSIVADMVDVHSDFLASNITTPKLTMPIKTFDVPMLKSYINAIDGVEGIFSEKNGSFMTSLDATNARIHIFDEKDINEVAGSVYHEVGHAAYQTNVLSQTEIGKLGGYVSMSLHESCSLYFELCLSNNRLAVEPSHQRNLKRLSADRIHYVFHIYIRMLIEEELFSGALKVTDINERWNELMIKYVGQAPDNVWDGFMQDVHWNSSLFGYFFSYAIGLVNAASKFQETKHLLTGNDVADTNNVLIPHIAKKYGKYNEGSSNIITDLNIDMGEYRNFVFDYFYMV